MPTKQQKCQHPACTCMAAEDSHYCSPKCEQQKAESGHRCACGHAGCAATQVAGSAR